MICQDLIGTSLGGGVPDQLERYDQLGIRFDMICQDLIGTSLRGGVSREVSNEELIPILPTKVIPPGCLPADVYP